MEEILEEYLNPQLNFNQLDRYYIRSSILETLKIYKQFLKGSLLDVGCGYMPYKEILTEPQGYTKKYVGLDLEIPATNAYGKVKPDVLWDGNKMPINDNSFDSCLATEVLEHCYDFKNITTEIYRILKPDGYFFLTVPFIWPLHDVPYDEFRYTPFSLEKILSTVGFKKITINALGGWNASMGQMLALWIKRAGLSNNKKKLIYYFCKPFIKWLYKTDFKPENFLEDSHMITGLSVLAQK